MQNKSLLNRLNIKYPIFQAPMAGVTTPSLVASVSNYGALGNIGAGYLSEQETRQQIKDVRLLTDAPFGINVFVPENNEVTEDQVNTSLNLMNEHLTDLGEPMQQMPDYQSVVDFDKQIEVILDEQPSVCSFTFGIPDDIILKEFKKQGIFTIGTATTVKEAELIEEAQIDAVVVQGSEAGGHRATFHREERLIGTIALIPQVVDAVSIPVIATGGLMDGRGLVASLSLGAKAAQFGTAFLTTNECGTNHLYKEALLNSIEEETELTKAFSGRTARGIHNHFIASMKQHEAKLPPFPYQNAFTSKIRQVAHQKKNKQYMSLWAGQATRLTQEDVSVNNLLDDIVKQYEAVRTTLEKLNK